MLQGDWSGPSVVLINSLTGKRGKATRRAKEGEQHTAGPGRAGGPSHQWKMSTEKLNLLLTSV